MNKNGTILKSQYPFEEYLKEIHAGTYMGTDDDMVDNYENWLLEMEGDDYIKHANVFGKLLIDCFVDKNLEELKEKAWMYDQLCK